MYKWYFDYLDIMNQGYTYNEESDYLPTLINFEPQVNVHIIM